MFKRDLENAEEPKIKLPISVGSSKKQEFQKNIYLCFIDYSKALDWVDHNKLWKILKELGHQTTLLASWKTCMQVNKQQLEPDKNNELLQNGESSTSRLYTVMLLT